MTKDKPPSGWAAPAKTEVEVFEVPLPCSEEFGVFQLDTHETMRHVFLKFHGIHNSYYIGVNCLRLFGPKGEIDYKIIAVDGQEGGDSAAAATPKKGGWWAVAGKEHSLLLEIPEQRVTAVHLYCANEGATPEQLLVSDAMKEGEEIARGWSADLCFALGGGTDATDIKSVTHDGQSLSLSDAAEGLNSGEIPCVADKGFRSFLSGDGAVALFTHGAEALAHEYFGHLDQIADKDAQDVPLSKARCVIDEPDRRGMRLSELRALRTAIVKRASKDHWTCTRSGAELLPEDVNLYNLCHYHICPFTVPEGVIFKDIPSGSQSAKEGTAVTQTGGAKGIVEKILEDGGIKVAVKQGRFAPGKEVSIDGGDSFVPGEVAHPGDCSYKELVAHSATVAKWFCSHWWGESVLDFIACCERHATDHKMSDSEASYWVCAYANRQHELGQDLSTDPAQSSFNKAMLSSQGTLLILDPQAVPFSRIWCDFEMSMTISRSDKPMDIVTVNRGRARLLSEGYLPEEFPHQKLAREQRFPIELLVKALRAQLELGEASMPIDKVRILNSVSSNSLNLDDPHILEAVQKGAKLQCFEVKNTYLRSAFALAAWPQAVKRSIVNNFDVTAPNPLALPPLIASALSRTVLELCLDGVLQVNDKELENIGNALPPSLQILKLSFSACKRVTDKGVSSLTHNFKSLCGLQTLHLNFFGITHLTGASLESVSTSFPWAVKDMSVDFGLCLGGEGTMDEKLAKENDAQIESFMYRLPHGLQRLHLAFTKCKDMTGAAYASICRGFSSQVDVLELDITGNRDLDQGGNDEQGFCNCDVGLAAENDALLLVRRLPKTLKKLTLAFGRHKKIGSTFADAFAQWLSDAMDLEELEMDCYMGDAHVPPVGIDGLKKMFSSLPPGLKALKATGFGRNKGVGICIAEHLPETVERLHVELDRAYSLSEIKALAPSRV